MDKILRYDGLKLGALAVTQVMSRAADGRLIGDSAATADPVDWIVGLLDAAAGHAYEADLRACLDITLRTGNTRQVATAAEVDRRRPFSNGETLLSVATARHIHTSRDAMRGLSCALRDGVLSGRDAYTPRLRELVTMPRMRDALAPLWARHDLDWLVDNLRTVLGDDAELSVHRLQSCLEHVEPEDAATLLAGVLAHLGDFSERTAATLRPVLRAHGLDAEEPVPPAPPAAAVAPPPHVRVAPPTASSKTAPPPTPLPRPIPVPPLLPVFERPERGSRPRRIIGLVPPGVVPPAAALEPEPERPAPPAPAGPPPDPADPGGVVGVAGAFRSKGQLGGKYAGRPEPKK
jgi:hypothetical protein